VAKVWTRLSLTSDHPFSHKVADGLRQFFDSFAGQADAPFKVDHAHDVLLVVHEDHSAHLWIDAAAVAVNAMLKRDVQRGEVIFESDIVDVVALDFPVVDISTTDKVIYLFREGWRFGLSFDFNPSAAFDRERFSRDLGTLYRRMKYSALYDLISNPALFSHLIAAGWFPFAEIVSREFKELLTLAKRDFRFRTQNNRSKRPSTMRALSICCRGGS